MTDFEIKYKETCKVVLAEIENAISSVDLNSLEVFVKDLNEAEKVFFAGVGRVMLSLEAFTKRLSHMGINAHCVGDITEPAITASGSGESIVPVVIAKKAKEIGCKKIVHIGSNPKGAMSEYADYQVRIPVQTRLYLPDEIKSEQIMTSLFEQSLLILGDVVSMLIVKDKGIDFRELWKYHANLE